MDSNICFGCSLIKKIGFPRLALKYWYCFKTKVKYFLIYSIYIFFCIIYFIIRYLNNCMRQLGLIEFFLTKSLFKYKMLFSVKKLFTEISKTFFLASTYIYIFFCLRSYHISNQIHDEPGHVADTWETKYFSLSSFFLYFFLSLFNLGISFV